MKRAIILVLDSFGVGAAGDAEDFGDIGSNTYGHIVEYCEKQGGRSLFIPNLKHLGLDEAARLSDGHARKPVPVQGAAYGCADELSAGKDTSSGHWEIAGLPVLSDWGYFRDRSDTFPSALLDDFIREAGLPGVLGNCHASGTTIIETLGELHQQTGQPIVYTSADSVFQIAAHETCFGLERLYQICAVARNLVDPYCVGRVIARPFIGSKGQFKRTANRRDFSKPPHDKTLLDRILEAGGEVVSVGKIADIFAYCGISQMIKGDGNRDLFDKNTGSIISIGRPEFIVYKLC